MYIPERCRERAPLQRGSGGHAVRQYRATPGCARLEARVGGLLERVREQAPTAAWFGDELIVPGAASTRPMVLDLIREAGGVIRGLTAEEGRLEEFYRELIEASS